MASNASVLMNLSSGLSLMVGLPRITYWETDRRPKNPKRGTFGFNTQTYSLEFYNGEDWFAAPLNKSQA